MSRTFIAEAIQSLSEIVDCVAQGRDLSEYLDPASDFYALRTLEDARIALGMLKTLTCDPEIAAFIRDVRDRDDFDAEYPFPAWVVDVLSDVPRFAADIRKHARKQAGVSV